MGKSFPILLSIVINVAVPIAFLARQADAKSLTSTSTDRPRYGVSELLTIDSPISSHDGTMEHLSEGLVDLGGSVKRIASGADNFNPQLHLDPPKPVSLPPKPVRSSNNGLSPSASTHSAVSSSNQSSGSIASPAVSPNSPGGSVSQPSSPKNAAIVPESLTTNFRRDRDNFGQENLFLETTPQFKLPNGDLLNLTTGVNLFKESDRDTLINVPLRVGWETRINSVKLRPEVGLDFFDRLPIAPNLKLNVETPISPSATLSGLISYGPYKFNATTLENQISAVHLSPSLFWQVEKDTQFFGMYRLGQYSDGNTEHQLIGRLEHRIGQFSIAANVFLWSFNNNVAETSGYFSPPDFLVYNGELAWEGKPFDFLRCRLSTTLGEQRLKGSFSNANTYEARCTAILSPQIEADLGYALSNVQNRSPDTEPFQNQSLSGQLRVKF
ncbi:hypothetical protein [Alkalinema sp. FACHB-956]|uniref:hypothetical protein n=1 Tax=Alkalinema sp. FACHB-956 TaxID=2692768 RepID=UPI00168603BC|nr:hypothetical protein [Alkalinema sp. FACHB-956]MBD2326573.1 hypothetical protein [Alkalinema sp. FACHB-956]